MRYFELVEAEVDTPEANDIADTLHKAGYKQLGTGADSTVWSNNSKNVVKVLMPEHGGSAAVNTFKKFADFCAEHQELPCIPRFLPINGKTVNKFEVNGKDYFMIAIEKLKPIKQSSFEEGMVWQLSDYATKAIDWDKVKEELSYPETWYTSEGDYNQEKMADRVINMDSEEEASYRLLYNVMTFLYMRGKINKLGWDLHTENVMQRDDGTLVIIDPWFEIQNDSLNEINNGYRWNDDKLYRHLV